MLNKRIRKTLLAIICAATTAAAAGCGGNAGNTQNQTAEAAPEGQTVVAEAEEQTADPAVEDRNSDTAENDSADSVIEGDAQTGDNTARDAFTDVPDEDSDEWKKTSKPKEEVYYEREVPVFDGELTGETVALRFYQEAPHVAYMEAGDYFDLLLGGGLECRAEGEGRYTLINKAGAEAEVDTVKGTMRVADLPAFENYYDAAMNGKMSSFKDSDAPYLRMREVVYLDDPQPVEFDFAGCGIALHGDDEKSEVWFPVSLLGTFLSDIAQNTVTFNGGQLYICRQKKGYSQNNQYFDTRYFNGITNGEARPDDLAAYTYGELCFIFRYMYGYPGRAALDTKILREQGFDAALSAAGEEGSALREELASTDFRQFWKGMFMISQHLLDDGHNFTELEMDLGDPEMTEKRRKFYDYMYSVMDEAPASEFSSGIMRTNYLINTERGELYMDSPYYKSKDTEVICFSSFFADAAGWENYYQNGGDLPADTLGIIVKGLRMAQEDGGIRNILFDVSTNTGGNTDVVMGILSLMNGKDYLTGYNELSKQRFRIYFDVDRNLDGVFDEKDAEVHYDFNYAALTSKGSFSCGNLFPFLVREAGGMLIGETSGGGSCSVQVADLSEGFEFMISGYKYKLCDDAGSDLEIGANPDAELEVGTKTMLNDFTGEEKLVQDYSAFADMDGICAQVSEWFTLN